MHYHHTRLKLLYYILLYIATNLVEDKRFELFCFLLAKQVSTPSRPIPQNLVLTRRIELLSIGYQPIALPLSYMRIIFNLLSILYALEGRNGYGIRSINCSGCPTTVHLTLAVTASNFTSGTPPIRACLAWAQGSRYLFHVVQNKKP